MNPQTSYQDRPLRVMQVHSLYPVYIPWYYARFPKVAEASFAMQTRAFLKDGLFALHMLTEELERQGCETMMVFANAFPLQKKWAEEHHCPEMAQDPSWIHSIFCEQVQNFKPDIVYFSDNHDFPAAAIEMLRPYRPPVICAWRCAAIDLATDWSGYDIIFSTLERIHLLAPMLGAQKGAYLPVGYPEWLGKKVDAVVQDTDLVFNGTFKTRFVPWAHAHRRDMLFALMEAANVEGFTLGLGLSDGRDDIPPAFRRYLRDQVYGVDMQIATRRGRMGLDIHGWIAGLFQGIPLIRLIGGEACNMRLYETAGGGSLALTEQRGRLDRYFTPDKEVVTYADTEELLKKIRLYRGQEELRQAIAIAGQTACRERFSKEKQVQRFLEVTTQMLHAKASGVEQAAHAHAALESKSPPPSQQTQQLLRLLQKIPAKREFLDQAIQLDHELFQITCRLFYGGHIQEAQDLDKAVMQCNAIQYDLGNIGQGQNETMQP